ncbi:hypothetical protein CJ030_MR5G023714 [Morella rubra]|uniref:FAD-dependent protein C-terminal domain-containing protein n=1 Tax=Morella rubra TaxID=262757 RepID=A0A6A1VJF2_9ROSI|nr:hypothetical protein CJ030_MR5G023714 [Morella rubra]
MKTLVHFGAPKSILVDGKPHLGTDRLIPLLRNFRQHLQGLGVTIKFGMRVDDLLVEDGHVKGVKVSDSREELQFYSQKLGYDGVVLAVGHSARDIYQMLLSHNMVLVPKDFAVGLRIEHPQELINRIRYSALATEVCKGRGKVPVADYKVAKYVTGEDGNPSSNSGAMSCSCYSFWVLGNMGLWWDRVSINSLKDLFAVRPFFMGWRVHFGKGSEQWACEVLGAVGCFSSSQFHRNKLYHLRGANIAKRGHYEFIFFALLIISPLIVIVMQLIDSAEIAPNIDIRVHFGKGSEQWACEVLGAVGCFSSSQFHRNKLYHLRGANIAKRGHYEFIFFALLIISPLIVIVMQLIDCLKELRIPTSSFENWDTLTSMTCDEDRDLGD